MNANSDGDGHSRRRRRRSKARGCNRKRTACSELHTHAGVRAPIISRLRRDDRSGWDGLWLFSRARSSLGQDPQHNYRGVTLLRKNSTGREVLLGMNEYKY